MSDVAIDGFRVGLSTGYTGYPGEESRSDQDGESLRRFDEGEGETWNVLLGGGLHIADLFSRGELRLGSIAQDLHPDGSIIPTGWKLEAPEIVLGAQVGLFSLELGRLWALHRYETFEGQEEITRSWLTSYGGPDTVSGFRFLVRPELADHAALTIFGAVNLGPDQFPGGSTNRPTGEFGIQFQRQPPLEETTWNTVVVNRSAHLTGTAGADELILDLNGSADLAISNNPYIPLRVGAEGLYRNSRVSGNGWGMAFYTGIFPGDPVPFNLSNRFEVFDGSETAGGDFDRISETMTLTFNPAHWGYNSYDSIGGPLTWNLFQLATEVRYDAAIGNGGTLPLSGQPSELSVSAELRFFMAN